MQKNANPADDSAFTAPTAKVLVADDVDLNLMVAEGMLIPYEMQIDLCESGEQSPEMILNGDYDLVFLDHFMPDLDGIKIARRVRSQSGFAALPLVAPTANTGSGVRDMYLQSGFNDFLSKPIDPAALGNILEKWLPPDKQVNT